MGHIARTDRPKPWPACFRANIALGPANRPRTDVVAIGVGHISAGTMWSGNRVLLPAQRIRLRALVAGEFVACGELLESRRDRDRTLLWRFEFVDLIADTRSVGELRVVLEHPIECLAHECWIV
jgi:hypothetical protein